MTTHLQSFTIADMVREQARTLPRAIALVEPSSSVTYLEADQRTDRWASWLAARGVGKGSRIAWLGPDSMQFVLLTFAAAKLGAHSVPLNWRSSDDELAGMVATASPTMLIFAEHPRAGARTWSELSCPVVDLAVVDDESASARLISPVSEDDELPVLGFFTAAWEGVPKLALLPHRAAIVQSLVMGAYREVDVADEVYLASGPLFHVGALLKLIANYLFGNKVVLSPDAPPAEIAELIEAEAVTSAYIFTPTIDRIARSDLASKLNLKSLRTTPAAPSSGNAERWYNMTSCRPEESSRVVGYGQTETWAMAVYTARGPETAALFGRPSPVACVRIVDIKGRELSTGETGEIVVRGPQVMSGYAGEVAETDWRHTGDLGVRVADGGVDFFGPRQSMIKTGMENVYPIEVEAALNQHPGIAASCVVGVPDTIWGEKVCAAVVTYPGHLLNEQTILGYVKSRIASYKTPRQLLVLDRLPTAGNGVDRATVQAMFTPTGSQTEGKAK